MKKSIRFYIALFSLIMFTGCKFNYTGNPLRIKIIKNEGNGIMSQCFFSDNWTVQGFDLETMELKTCIKLNHFVTTPFVHNNKLILGDQGDLSDWGGNLFILDENYKLNNVVEAVSNIYKFLTYDNYLIATSFCYFENGAGISIFDLNDYSLIKHVTNLKNIVMNDGDYNCGYNGKIYLVTESQAATELNPGIDNSVTIFDVNNFDDMKTTEIYTNEFLQELTPSILIHENKLWINFKYSNIIDVYDLDTNTRIKRFYVKDYFDIDNDGEYNTLKHFIKNGLYYTVIRKEHDSKENYLAAFNTETLEFSDSYKLPDEPLVPVEGFKSFEGYDDYVYYSTYGKVYKYSLSQKKVVAQNTFLEL